MATGGNRVRSASQLWESRIANGNRRSSGAPKSNTLSFNNNKRASIMVKNTPTRSTTRTTGNRVISVGRRGPPAPNKSTVRVGSASPRKSVVASPRKSVVVGKRSVVVGNRSRAAVVVGNKKPINAVKKRTAVNAYVTTKSSANARSSNSTVGAGMPRGTTTTSRKASPSMSMKDLVSKEKIRQSSRASVRIGGGSSNRNASMSKSRASLSAGKAKRSRRMTMSKNERRDLRKSRRETIHQQQNTIDAKVHEFVNSLATMEESMQKERAEMDDLTERFAVVSELLSRVTKHFDELRNDLNGLVEVFPIQNTKDLKGWKPFHKNLLQYQEKYRTAYHDYFVNVAKSTKKIQEYEKKATPNAPKPAPAPIPPSVPTTFQPKRKDSLGGGLQITDLLGDIQRGAKLKVVNQDAVRKEREKNLEESRNVAFSLHEVLCDALDARNLALLDSDEDEDDWDD